MSTAGKVLVVLVLLVAPIWIVLFSAYAEYTKSGTQALAVQKALLVKETTAAKANERAVALAKDEIGLEQRAMDEQLAVLRSRQAGAERARTELAEVETRVKLQVAGIEAAAKNATLTRDERKAEQAAVREALAATRARVEKLQEEHAELTAQLDKLREEFKQTVESNRTLVNRLAKANHKPGS